MQLSSSQEASLLAARRTLLTSLSRLANARSEILAALGMQLLQTHRVQHDPAPAVERCSAHDKLSMRVLAEDMDSNRAVSRLLLL